MGLGSVLFIGGTGVISASCAREAVRAGFDVTVLNRGVTHERRLPPEVRALQADVRDAKAVREALDERTFDVVANFLVWTRQEAMEEIERFSGRVGQYVFISSASAYQKPPRRLPITESTPLVNPMWAYSRDKIACEETFMHAHRENGFPVTIVRPSHTYDRTTVPFEGRWTVVERMRRGLPVVVHGDGTSLWVLTHHEDFARAFVLLLGDQRAVGDNFHITSDEVLTWDQIHKTMAEAAGAEAKLVHVASERIVKVLPEWSGPILGDKCHSVVFDNTKVRQMAPGWFATTPFAVGAREIVAWHDANEGRRKVDDQVNAAMDKLAGL